jgi:hypothetical protein
MSAAILSKGITGSYSWANKRWASSSESSGLAIESCAQSRSELPWEGSWALPRGHDVTALRLGTRSEQQARTLWRSHSRTRITAK